MRRIAALFTLLFAVALTACSPTPAAVTSASDSGPQRVVVLDYAALDTMDALGLSSRVVGTPTATLPKDLQSFAKVKNAGTLVAPDIEAIAALTPDLIIIGARTAAKADELGKIAPTLNMALDYTNLIESNSKNTLELAKRFGKTDLARTKLSAIETSMKNTADKKTSKTALIVMVSGGKLSAFGQGSRFSLIHNSLGIPAVDTTLSTDKHGQAISFEYIAKVDPDIIYVIDRDAAFETQGQSAAQVLSNELVASTKAAKNGKIVHLDGARWYLVGGGLNTLQAMTNEAAAPLA